MFDCFGQFLIGAHVVGSISAAFSQLTTAGACLQSPQEALRDTKATAARRARGSTTENRSKCCQRLSTDSVTMLG
jgi:hypothetical protein